jgi:hypothetical protein
MLAGFEFILVLFKISILSGIYAAIWLFCSLIIANKFPSGWFAINTDNKKKYWFFSGLVIFAILFLFSLSNWGNRGLGDFRRIPIGPGLAVESIEGSSSIKGVRTSEYKSLELENFKIESDKVVGRFAGNHTNSFFVFEINSQYLREFNSEIEFNGISKNEGLPSSDQLLTFDESYKDYWGGWRSWFLP